MQQKQRLAIQRLQNENNKLKDEILLDNKCNPSGHGYATSVQISKLQDQADLYTRKIETEKRRVADLDKQIAEMNQRIMEQRRQMGGVNAARENNQQTQRQIKILENRLEKALVKYNEALGKNKKLKEEIDSLRRERLVFDQIYKKLEKELEEKKREMANIIEVSNSAYEARNAALQVRKNYGSERGERVLTCSLSLSPPPSRFFCRPAGAHHLAEPGGQGAGGV